MNKSIVPSYCNIIDDSYINVIKNLLKTTIKKYTVENIKYSELNSSIDYNQVLSKMLSNIDNAIECLIESNTSGNKEKALKYIEDCFLNNNEIYDYIITSDMFNKFAMISNIKTYPVSSIGENQKIIIKDNRKIKSNSISLNEIDEYYTDLKLFR